MAIQVEWLCAMFRLAMGDKVRECCSNNVVVNPVKYDMCQMPSGGHCAVIFLWRTWC